jgi:hypothetical protein
MLLSAFRTGNYIGQVYSYTQTVVDNVTTPVYAELPTAVRMNVTTNLLGELLIFTDVKMQINTKIKSIVDRKSNQIYTNATWLVIETQPVLNALGFSEGYKYRAELIDGAI